MSFRLVIVFVLLFAENPLAAQDDVGVTTVGDSVRIAFMDVELRTAVQALAPFLDRPIIFGALNGQQVTIETPRPIARANVVDLLRGLLQNQGFTLRVDSAGMYQVDAPVPAPPPVREQTRRQAEASSDAPELFLLRLRHARAADVAGTVNALYGRADALGELGAPGGTLGEALEQNRVPATREAESAVGGPGRSAVLDGSVVIVPDEGTNSLLIRASRADFDLIEATVQQIDVRPLQVLIEVLIVEARRDRSLQFGVGATLPETNIGGTDATVSGTTTGLSLGDFVLQVMGLGVFDLDATLVAAAAKGEAAIVSRPVVIAANNEWAEITVGSQRPFVQVSRSLPTDTPSRDQVVQYKDVGTQLSVRPTISDEGFVTLEITQEVNAATAETAFDAPVISTRAVRTKLLIRDGQTIVLGGLTDQQRESSSGGVPLLSDLPMIGGLFGRQSKRRVETELFVFLTPRILRTDDDVTRVTEPRENRARQMRR